MSSDFVLEIRRALADNASPEKAEGMRAYMKSEMLFHGVQKPLRRKLFREALEAHLIAEKGAWSDAVLDLWRNAAYREERYMALELAGAKQYLPFRELDTMAIFEEMVVAGAWWDFVDEVATHRLREILERFPEDMSRRMRLWSHDANMWKRRSAIICQVGRKERTDVGLLFDCIEPSLSHPDFFIRKGIGWALRDLAWTDLETVESYVSRNEARLSSLSRREALKNGSKIRGAM